MLARKAGSGDKASNDDLGGGYSALQAELERHAQKVRGVGAPLDENAKTLLSDADMAANELWTGLARARDQHLRACTAELRDQLAKCVQEQLMPTLEKHKVRLVSIDCFIFFGLQQY